MGMDAGLAVVISAGLAGGAGLLTGFLGKRVSSRAEDQVAFNNRVATYMTVTDKTIAEVREAQRQCERREKTLRYYINQLIRELRKHGIPVPLLDEDLVPIEDKRFDDPRNGSKP